MLVKPRVAAKKVKDVEQGRCGGRETGFHFKDGTTGAALHVRYLLDVEIWKPQHKDDTKADTQPDDG